MQQINLYVKEFQPDSSPLRLIHMLWIGMAFVVLLMVFSLVYSAGIKSAKTHQLAVEQDIADLRKDLNVFSVADAATKTVSWERKIAEAEAQLSLRTQIRALIQQQDFGNAVGFSQQLITMAHSANDAISLTHIGLQNGGAYVELEGVVTQTDAVPLYLQKLHVDPAFSDSAFGVITITQDEKNSAQHNFSISSAADNKG